MKQFLALKASAGSGKTFALTVRYISLLLNGAKPKEILTLTFTNKAANEMSERIYHTLLALGEDEAYLKEIVKQSKLTKELILSKKEELVKEYTNATLSIFTIDKFINMILREFCGYIGVSDDFEIKEDDIEALSIKFLESLDLENFDKLIDFQLYEKKKYSSLFDIFQNLLEKNEQIETVNIDATLISTQKKEVLKKALKLKEFILNAPLSSTSAKNAVDFHSFEELLLKGKSWLSKDSVAEFKYFKKPSNELLESFFQEIKKELAVYYKLREAYTLGRLFELFKLFKEFKKSFNISKNYLHFSDISNLVYELLSTKIDKDFLYFRLDSKYSHILIDEFQDTSLLQYRILKPLIDEILSSNDKYNTFFYVGDIKQSIYRFRGGKRELFDYVLKSNSQIQEQVLNINYRSSKNIVDFVNSVFMKLDSYEYYEQDTIHQDGYVEVIEDSAFSQEQKYVNIAKKISQLMQSGVNSNDIAILTYTNDDVLNLYSYLKKMFPTLKISTEMTSRLINQENVKALINMVKYLYFQEELYKESLNAILGKKPGTSLNINIDIKQKSVQETLYDIATVLNIVDENIIRLIELSATYKNIVEFIYEIDKLDSAIENQEQTGLQILTIFKSKGLEFHTVLLIDRIKQKNSDKSSLLFEYEGVELKNIFYKISGLENYNEEYKRALEKEKSLAYEDDLNILYVALTRAKKNMVVFKKQKASVFDLLDLKVHTVGEVIKSENSSINHERSEKVLYQPLNLGVQEKPIQAKDDEKEYSLYSRYFGIATHYCLEMMNDFTEHSLYKALNLTKSRFSSYLLESDFLNIEKRVLKLLENTKFMNFVREGEYDKEQALLYKGELKIIDLLVKKDDKYYIFDYKTTKDELKEHELQVAHYKEALKQIVNSSEVYTYIIYLKSDNSIVKEVS